MTKATLHFTAADFTQSGLNPKRLGLTLQLAAFIVGADRAHLARSPDAERGVVVWSSLSLLAAFAFSAASWIVALGIARGAGHPEHYAIAALFGFIVTCIDRAMIRTHWLDYGERMGRLRQLSPFQSRGPLRALTVALRWGFRLFVTLTLTFNSAAFLELELFRTDTDAALLAANVQANRPVYAAAARQVDREEGQISADIQRLDAQAAALIASAAQSDAAAQGARTAQVATLQAERETLLRRGSDLAKAIACAKQDQIAERYAVVRCDGQKAVVAKEGAKFKAASEQLDFLMTEQAQIAARNAEVEARLAEMGRGAQPPLTAVRDQMDGLATERARLAASLRDLQDRRDSRTGRDRPRRSGLCAAGRWVDPARRHA